VFRRSRIALRGWLSEVRGEQLDVVPVAHASRITSVEEQLNLGGQAAYDAPIEHPISEGVICIAELHRRGANFITGAGGWYIDQHQVDPPTARVA
jgi:hypothetical protein